MADRSVRRSVGVYDVVVASAGPEGAARRRRESDESQDSAPRAPAVISVVIPAYNEAAVVGRLLDALGGAEHGLEVVVVCNGCTDDTESVARDHPSQPRVLSLPEGSKHGALLVGDAASAGFPRFYVDADVVVSADDIHAMAAVLEAGAMAVAPERSLSLQDSSRTVRAYYRLWERLPSVRTGLYGRGVVGVSEAGYSRIALRPEVMGDDLYVHSRFSPPERRIVPDTTSVVRGPRSTVDLVRRRVRAAQGNTQLARVVATSPPATGIRDIASVVRADPSLLPSAAVFLGVTALARAAARARRNDSTWLRDESSRNP